MRHALLFALLASLSVIATQPARAEDDAKLGIAVLNPTTSGDIPADLSPVLAGLISTRLDQPGVFRVVTEDDVKRIVSFDQMKTALSCDDQASCLSEVGAALGVPWLLTSHVAQLGATYIVNLTLIDIDNARSVKRESSTYPSLDALVAGLPAQVERTTASLLYRHKGKLLVIASEEGATVAVDGSAIGTTPLPEQEVASGPHRVTVVKEGFIQHAVDVTVQPKEQALVDARLRPSPEFLAAYQSRTGGQRLAAIGSGVAGVVGVAAGAVGLTLFAVQRQGLADELGENDDGTVLLTRGTDQEQSYNSLLASFWGGIGAGVVGVALGATSAALFFSGEDPARYDVVGGRAE